MYININENKKNVPMNVYFATKNWIKNTKNKTKKIGKTHDKKVESFCKNIIDKVKNGESVFIWCDAKNYAHKIKTYLKKYNNNIISIKLRKYRYKEKESFYNCEIEVIIDTIEETANEVNTKNPNDLYKKYFTYKREE